MTDWQLLRDYAENRSEAAFARSVEKHIKLVYWTCRRSVGDAHLAEDATQAVFVLLAQKAKSQGRNVSISGWLFNAARLVGMNAARAERRRRAREEEALESIADRSVSRLDCAEIESRLNDALAILTPGEREVIFLRYFENLSYREIGRRIGTAENTASKRAGYAVEKMRRFLTKREVVASTAAVALILAEQSARAVPDSCRIAVSRVIHDQLVQSTTSAARLEGLASLHKGVYLALQAARIKLAVAVVLLLTGGALWGVVGWHAYQAHASDAAAAARRLALASADDGSQIRAKSPETSTGGTAAGGITGGTTGDTTGESTTGGTTGGTVGDTTGGTTGGTFRN